MNGYHFSGSFIATVWLLYLTGQYISILGRAYGAVNSKLNSIAGYEQWFKLYSIPLLIRAFLAVLAMFYWEYNPDVFSVAVLYYAPQKWVDLGLISKHTLSLNPFTAGLLGFVIDSVLDKVLIVISKLPSLEWLHLEVPPAGAAKP